MPKRRCSKLQTLDDYFLKSASASAQSEIEIQAELNVDESQPPLSTEQLPSCSSSTTSIENFEINSRTSSSNISTYSTFENENTTLGKRSDTGPVNDISRFCNKVLTDAEKINVLNNIWIPSDSYAFPVTISGAKEKKLKFQYSWLSKWKWLAYSKIENGAYCKYCVVFSKTGAGVNFQSLGALAKKKFDNWRKAIETFDKHSLAQYHLNSLRDGAHFLEVDKNNLLSIENKLSADRTAKILQNRQNIIPIIEAVILCGIQEIALRGHRDSGKILTTVEADKSEGNFRAILRYRAKGDEKLRKALEGPGERNKYISPSIQNQIIDSCNVLIVNKIVAEVNMSKCFSILADETADIAGVEQVSLCVRYVDTPSMKVKEHFLQFVQAQDVTGRGLANIILENLRNWGIDTSFLKGQGYDGAAAMSGKFNGVQAHIKLEHPTALYVHCAAHSLNLAVSKASEVPEIRNCLGTVGQTHNFFVYPKRKNVLTRVLADAEISPKAKTLKRMCATRWIERFDSVSDFKEIYVQVIDALSEIAEWTDKDTSKEARSILNSILQGQFMIALFVTAKVFAIGRPLSKHMQKIDVDLRTAVSLAEETASNLQNLRTNADNEFKEIFEQATKLGNEVSISIQIPRLTAIQKHRSNPTNLKTPEDFYRVTLFIPYIDRFINELVKRFISHKEILLGFQCLFPANNNELASVEESQELQKNFEHLVNIYLEDLVDNSEVILAERKMWFGKLLREDNIPTNAMAALSICNQDIFPNMFILYKILATLPVSTASSERSFSTLKRIKTYLRNTMSEVYTNIIN